MTNKQNQTTMSDKDSEQQQNVFSANDVEEMMGDENDQQVEDQQQQSKPEETTTTNNNNTKKRKHPDSEANTEQPPTVDLQRQDKTLSDMLELMSDPDFTPIIPPAVANYYLSKSGLNLPENSPNSDKLIKILSLATQKFVSDIAHNAYEYNRIRSSGAVYNASNPTARTKALLMATTANAQGKHNDDNDEDTGENAAENTNSGGSTNLGGANNQGGQKVVLTMEDLSSALDEYGLNVNRPQFYR